MESRPLEGIFGNNAELRLVEFMLPLEGIEYNVIELAKEIEVSVKTMTKVANKLASWGILNVATRPETDSRALRNTYYTINIDSPLTRAIIDLDNEIIVIILEREGLGSYEVVHGQRVVVPVDEKGEKNGSN